MKTVQLRKKNTTPFRQQPEKFVNTKPTMPVQPVEPVNNPVTNRVTQPVENVEQEQKVGLTNPNVVNNNVRTGEQENINTQSNPTLTNAGQQVINNIDKKETLT
jgi:hypothetical protein